MTGPFAGDFARSFGVQGCRKAVSHERQLVARVRMYANVSRSAHQCERQVSGKAIGSLRTRSRLISDIQWNEFAVAKLPVQDMPRLRAVILVA